MKSLRQLPHLGVGLGFRRQISESIFENIDKIDWLEIISENHMGVGGAANDALERALSSFTVLPHGVNLSIGATDPLNNAYLRQLASLLRKTRSPWVSDHLCFTTSSGRYTQQLLPLPRTNEAVKHVVARVKEVQERLEVPFLLENITHYLTFSESTMSESQFLSEVCEKADCGIVLDINNAVVNALNFGFDERRFVDELDPARVVQIHIAGHKAGEHFVLDTHAEPISDRVYSLLEYTLARMQPKAILLERDDNFPQFEDLAAELQLIRLQCERFRTFSSAALQKDIPAEAIYAVG